MCGISGKGHEMRFYDSYERYIDSLADDLKWMGGDDFLLTGDRERIIYTYRREPLGGLRPGWRFRARIDHGTRSLRSALTGGVWNREDTSRAVSYDGRAFGAFHAFEILDLEKAMEKVGWRLYLDCRFKEYYVEDWPEIVTYTPNGAGILTMADIIGEYGTWPIDGDVYARDVEVRREREREKSIRKRTGSRSANLSKAVETTFSKTSDRVTCFMRGHVGWKGECVVRLKPSACGSQAKPRPYLETADDPPRLVYVSRITRKEYPLLVDNVGARLHVSIELLSIEGLDDRWYRLTIAP